MLKLDPKTGRAKDQTERRVGEVTIWRGPLNILPANWQLCDGTNDTPDLKNDHPPGKTPGTKQNPVDGYWVMKVSEA